MNKPLRKSITTFAGITGIGLSLFFVFAKPAAAADYTITITDNNVSKNQNVIYDYANIGPGFSADANIVINNDSNFATQVKLIDVAQEPTDPNKMLPYVQLTLSQNGTVLGQGAFNSDTLLGASTCIDPHFSTTLTNNFVLPSSVGNVAQNTSMHVIYTFQIEENNCETFVPPPAPNAGGKPNTLPPTGETMWPFWILGGTTILFFGLALFFLFLVLLKRRHDSRHPTMAPIDNAPMNHGKK